MRLGKLKKYHYKTLYGYNDGFYQSYWCGKFVNSFIVDGKKNIVEKKVNKAYNYIKILIQIQPLEILLEIMERVKPSFNVGHIEIRGRLIEYPIYLRPFKQYKLALFWIKHLVRERLCNSFEQQIYYELCDLYYNKRHSLVKRRDELFSICIDKRFNVRYSFIR